MNAPQIQAEISKCQTKRAMWNIIKAAPEEYKKRLISHADAVAKNKGLG